MAATISALARPASGPLTTAVHVSFCPGSSFERKLSHFSVSCLFVHGTCTMRSLKYPRFSRTKSVRTVNPPRIASVGVNAIASCVRSPLVQ